MVFVGLTSWQRDSDSDREWFGRSTGWFAAAAIVWFAVAFADPGRRRSVPGSMSVNNYAKYVSAVACGGLRHPDCGTVLGKSPAAPSRKTRRQACHQQGSC